jgi:hypothetical protein
MDAKFAKNRRVELQIWNKQVLNKIRELKRNWIRIERGVDTRRNPIRRYRFGRIRNKRRRI